MTHDRDEERIVRQVAEMMDRDLLAQDSETRMHLAAIRHQALAPQAGVLLRTWWSGMRGWGLAAATVSVVAVALLALPRQPVELLLVEPLELAALAEEADLYADIEFYLWLEEQEDAREL